MMIGMMKRLLTLLTLSTIVSAGWFPKKKQYTPLVFFKEPLSPECEEMEQYVSQLERDLDVRVERLDIKKDYGADAALAVVSGQEPPFLYHRESCQAIYEMPSPQRLQAWAQGKIIKKKNRMLPGKQNMGPTGAGSSQQESDMEDLILTPEQLQGKQNIEQRTREQASR